MGDLMWSTRPPVCVVASDEKSATLCVNRPAVRKADCVVSFYLLQTELSWPRPIQATLSVPAL